MNVAIIQGRLVKNPEIKMKDDKQILLFSVACNRDKEHTDFIDCIAFDNNAKFISDYFKKGSGINIIGALRQSTYEKDGKTMSVVRVQVNAVTFPIQNKKEESDTNNKWESAKDMPIPQEDLPFYG